MVGCQVSNTSTDHKGNMRYCHTRMSSENNAGGSGGWTWSRTKENTKFTIFRSTNIIQMLRDTDIIYHIQSPTVSLYSFTWPSMLIWAISIIFICYRQLFYPALVVKYVFILSTNTVPLIVDCAYWPVKSGFITLVLSWVMWERSPPMREDVILACNVVSDWLWPNLRQKVLPDVVDNEHRQYHYIQVQFIDALHQN